MQKGRKKEVLDHFFEELGKEKCKHIKSISLDGARTYISSCRSKAPGAAIVYDKFHVVQKLNKAVNDQRNIERKIALKNKDPNIALFSGRFRFILLKKKSNRKQWELEHLEKLCSANQPIFQAMILKDSFMDFYNQKNREMGEQFLKDWIVSAKESGLSTFKKIAESFSDKSEYLLNWFKNKKSSAISEGFNNKIKRLKRMAYGYHDVDYLCLKIHQHCGLLHPRFFENKTTEFKKINQEPLL